VFVRHRNEKIELQYRRFEETLVVKRWPDGPWILSARAVKAAFLSYLPAG